MLCYFLILRILWFLFVKVDHEIISNIVFLIITTYKYNVSSVSKFVFHLFHAFYYFQPSLSMVSFSIMWSYHINRLFILLPRLFFSLLSSSCYLINSSSYICWKSFYIPLDLKKTLFPKDFLGKVGYLWFINWNLRTLFFQFRSFILMKYSCSMPN